MQQDISKMVELNNRLIEASIAYYNDSEIMSNYEYDELYDQLCELEKRTGVVLSNSVTHNVGAPGEVDKFKKVKHISPMQSLKKTKSVKELESFLGDEKGCLSWKLDGLTVVLTYNNGELVKAATRGDGINGEDITSQAKMFSNIPVKINHKQKLIIRGEALISYDEFNRIKENEGYDFKNPRNLASGTVKSLDLKVLMQRRIEFIAFTLVDAEFCTFSSYNEQLEYLDELGFTTVQRALVDSSAIDKIISIFTKSSKDYDYPVDGVVLFIDDLGKHEELGTTSNHPNYGIAFKWQDETQQTVIRSIEWSVSRTGRVNPVAVFDPVEIDGTTVERASLHNLSYIEDMKLGIGDEVEVYKANMIIPQIAKNLTQSLTSVEDIIPKSCPNCGGSLVIDDNGSAKYLYCKSNCSLAEQLYQFLNTLGVKEFGLETIKKLHDYGVVNNRSDLFNIASHKDTIVSTPGFGERTYSSLVNEIENISVTEGQILASLGIEGCGLNTAESIVKEVSLNDIITLHGATKRLQQTLYSIKGVGEVISESIATYFYSDSRVDELKTIISNVNIIDANGAQPGSLSGIVFAITGKLNNFKNRSELVDLIKANGGEVSVSINNSTDYLVNNDIDSASSKNKKAKQLGVMIITEEELLNII